MNPTAIVNEATVNVTGPLKLEMTMVVVSLLAIGIMLLGFTIIKNILNRASAEGTASQKGGKDDD